jgi:hypothetical protein
MKREAQGSGREEHEALKTNVGEIGPRNPLCRLSCASSSLLLLYAASLADCGDLRGTRSGCVPWVVGGVVAVLRGSGSDEALTARVRAVVRVVDTVTRGVGLGEGRWL